MQSDRPIASGDDATGKRIVIVGAGVAGLSAAREVMGLLPNAEVLVLEGAERVGGLVETERTPDGFLVENGPDSLLTMKPANMRAIDALSLRGELVGGADAPRRSFLAQGSALVPMPDGLSAGIPSAVMPWLRSPLLSPRGKLRLMCEPLIPSVRGEQDESVANFVTRRFGAEVLQRVVEPLMVGIYGAEAEKLSVMASMPQLAMLERSYGSIAWGTFRTRSARASGAGAPGAPMVVSLRGGITQLTDALASGLGDRLRLSTAVRRIERGTARRYRLRLDQDALDADAVIVAAPAYAAAELVAALDADLARALAAVPHGSLLCTSLAFRRQDVPHPLDGTGFIVPATERRATSACSFMCRKWPGRAPAGFALIRSFLRGIPVDSTDDAVSSAALADLRDLMGITAPPLWSRVRRRALALPRFEVGHAARVQGMMRRADELGAFALAGNAYYGVGIAECLQSGQRAAERVRDALDRRNSDAR